MSERGVGIFDAILGVWGQGRTVVGGAGEVEPLEKGEQRGGWRRRRGRCSWCRGQDMVRAEDRMRCHHRPWQVQQSETYAPSSMLFSG